MIFVILLVVTYYSAPPPAPDYFTQTVTASFPFFYVLTAGEKQVGSVAYGTLNFTSKGSISAGNVLNVSIVAIINQTFYGSVVSNVLVYLDGAFKVPNSFDTNGVTRYIELPLSNLGGEVWKGSHFLIEYNQGGLLPIQLLINGSALDGASGYVQIGSQDVTLATRTNSLVICLTWAILAFAVLELRVDTYQHKTDNQ